MTDKTDRHFLVAMAIGLVAVWCRSFDHVLCSKGDEGWAQVEKMKFTRMRYGSR
jgi:hypothetical protein